MSKKDRNQIVFGAEKEALIKKHAAYTSMDQLAIILDCSINTLRRVFQSQPEMLQLYRREKALVLSQVNEALVEKAKAGDTAALTLWLKQNPTITAVAPEPTDTMVTIKRFNGETDVQES